MASKVLVDSKTNYPAACNSLETLLVNKAVVGTILPKAAAALIEKGVVLKCDPPSKEALAHLGSNVQDAGPEDFDTEFLSLTLAVKVVESLEEAILHINTHGSHHTETILTSDADEAERFMSAVDCAGAYWNASSRFADGMRYGFGTEVGISTNKIHSRGPVGLDGLMIYKYKLRGQGHISAEFGSGEGQREYKHEKLAL